MTTAAARRSADAAPKGWKVTTSGRSMDVLSRQWMARSADERFLSLDALEAATRKRAEATKEVTLKNGQIEIISPPIGKGDTRDSALMKSQQLLLGMPGGSEVAPSNWAFSQIAGLAGAGSAVKYLRTMPSTIVSDALTYGLRYNRDPEDVKLYVDDMQAMAATGPDYGRVFNWELAQAVRLATSGMSGDHRWKIPGMLDWHTMNYDPNHPVTADTTTLFANDRGVFIFLCQDLAPIEIGKLRDGSPDLVFRGFYVTNSEVGAGSIRLGAMYLRAVCCNRILWGVEGFQELTMRHTRYAPMRFIEEAQPALRSFANGSEVKLLEGVRKAKEARIAETKDEALVWLAGRNIARKRGLAIFDRIVREERGGDEADRPVTAWEMAQGMTAQARDEINFDTRMDLESDARKLLDKVA